jgi:5'-nucleotidase / UDP-sugar diphosphatase
MADIVVALVHLGQDEETPETWRSTTVAEMVDGIDVMIDGHSHTTLEEGAMHGDTLLASAGSYAINLGVVELVITEGEVTEASARLITKEASAETAEDPDIMALIEVYDAMGQEALAEVAGETTVELVGVRELVRAGETNLGNLLTDAMLDLSGADIAFSNGGGIRASIPAGTITRGNIVEVFPFGNLVEVKEVTGAMMKEILEHGTDAYPEPAGKFPHVGGMTYQIDLSRPVGDRIVNMMIDGNPWTWKPPMNWPPTTSLQPAATATPCWETCLM